MLQRYTIKNGRIMTVQEASETERVATPERAAALAAFLNADGTRVSVASAAANAKKTKGGK